MVVLIASFSSAAKIYGNAYGPGLELLKNTVVSVNSTPQQTLVAADGAYSFELAPGNYIIEAYNSENSLYDKEELDIKTEGSYVLDLILFEMAEIDELDLNESELVMIEDLFKETKPDAKDVIITVLIAALIIAGAIAYVVFRYKKLKGEKPGKRKKPANAKKVYSPDKTLDKVINFIKKEKRTTQKEIRKGLGMSEAKVSLLITDLEDRGMIRKIKKGRGNVIIYNK
jgi:uncharacterized membrane protein